MAAPTPPGGPEPDALSCPDHDVLEQFVGLGLPAGEVAAHVRGCEHCSRRAEMIAADNALLGEFVQANRDRLGSPRPVTAGEGPAGYVLGEEIHRGGQGVVYRAFHEATRRTVAVKITLQGAFASERQRLRFEREVELVASLRHPGIVTVYDSGMTADGRPYLAMELVEGRTLDEYLRAERPAFDRLLELFAGICEAVAAAHRRGIIHRDLKPANVLVDEAGAPRVLDFGVAKFIGPQRAIEAPLATVAGEFLGTFAYAAPEQVSGDTSLIDTRADEYALGVILYEMLAGRRPYEMSGSMCDVVRTILETVPPPPSTVQPAIDRDLDTITMRTLAKDPERRYQSVQSLLEDVRRRLTGEPINARRDDRWYVLRRTLARHKREVAAAAGVFLLVCAFAVTGWGLWRRSVVQTHRGSTNLAGWIQTIASVNVEDPDAPMPTHSVLGLLDMASMMVRDLEAFPQDEAKARTSLGLAFLGHSRFEDADRHLRRALEIHRNEHEAPHPAIAAALHDFGRAHWKAGRYDPAERLYREALAMRRALYGNEHPDVARTLHHLATTLRERGRLSEALAMNLDALNMRRRILPPGSPDIGNSLNGVGNCLYELGRFGEAADRMREALEILRAQPQETDPAKRGQGDWRESRAMHNLARCLVDLGAIEEAERLLEQSLAIKRRFQDERTLDVASGVHEIARIRLRQGRIAEAEEGCRKALAVRTAMYEHDHPERADSLTLLGEILLQRDEVLHAEDHLRHALNMRRGMTVERTWAKAHTSGLLGECLKRQGRLEEARPLLAEAAETMARVHGEESPLADRWRQQVDGAR